MPNDGQLLPLARSIGYAGEVASQNRIQRVGRCYPCSVVSVSGALVTVKFEMNADPFTLPQVQMPLFGPEYVRYPIQQGDKGFAIAADAYLGQMSGMGPSGQVADLTEQPNLSTLVFMPIGNKNWRAVDHNAVVIYGPNGVVLQDSGQACTITLTPNGASINLGSNPLTITAQNCILDSSGNLAVIGEVVAKAGSPSTEVHLSTHETSQVQHGTQVSGPPVPGT